ncbi:2-dehydro-3-deoxygalactonokinase [Sagittula sp. SSi028]|uniref:2-dehydro-3-deoxygalactonokinase n=1 Tax=Sagittula sp. SSi028 TaxID=3400636 RepID=UPI003AF77918
MTTTQADWLAMDWGTSNLRVWVMGEDGAVRAALSSDQGMGRLAPDQFETALLDLVAPYLPDHRIPVLACGMVGAKQGWAEAPYRKVPCKAPRAAQAIRPLVRDDRLDVRILPGLKQASPADVMRGEETQIAGYLGADPQFDGVICLPGTHSKWVHISAEEIVSFRTFMTGEMFDLLSGQSVLRHSVTSDDWDEAAFDEALADAMGAPQRFAARLFGLRAAGLLDGLSPATARARLSGMLIGLELAGAKEYWLGQQVVLIGAPRLQALYGRALKAQGVEARGVDGADIVLAGLTAAYKETTQ